jgi:hypothetical protein
MSSFMTADRSVLEVNDDETQELREEQAKREEAERRLADETGEHAAVRRADKHAYLREKLEEREKSEDG